VPVHAVSFAGFTNRSARRAGDGIGSDYRCLCHTAAKAATAQSGLTLDSAERGSRGGSQQPDTDQCSYAPASRGEPGEPYCKGHE